MKKNYHLNPKHKPLTAFVLCTFLILLSPFSFLPCSAQPYTVYSCDFENWTDGKPDGWQFGDYTTVSQYTPAYSGNYACKITGKVDAYFNSTETFPIYWGKKYVLSFVAKLVKGRNIELAIRDNVDYNDYFLRFQKRIELGTEWQEYEIEFTPGCQTRNSLTGYHAPASTSGNTLRFMIYPSGGGSYDTEFVIDNIKLVAKDHTMEFDYLDVNNIKTYIDPIVPFLHWDHPRYDIQYFEVPKGSGKSTILSSNIWLGGKDASGQVSVAAQTFCQRGFDFWVGPISEDGQMITDTLAVGNWTMERVAYSDAYIQKYYHTWKVSRAEINYHRAHYADPGYVMPPSIAQWPAHGRTEHGESANLAPYKSVSGSAVYNPWQGDYPDIRGDQAVLFMMNDRGGVHYESKCPRSLGVEILGMAYAFNSPNEMLNNTIFLSYNLHNKSETHYEDFYFGFWSDFDIGCYYDDYVGCDTLLNLMYGYNGMEIDGNGESWAYGANPPAQGFMFLNQKMSAFIYHQNSGGTPTSDPDNYVGFYNFLRALWNDGLPVTMWGTGYNPSSTDYTRYMFSGNPIEKTGWTEYTPQGPGSSPNAPGDRRGLMSAGPFTFPAGGNLNIDIALPFARSNGKNPLASLALLKEFAAEIQEYFDEHIIGIKDYKDNKSHLKVYPNPSNGQFTVNSEQIIESIELYDILGKKVFTDTPKDFTTQINTRLPQGLYIYRAVLQDQSVASGKVIVQ